MSYRVSLIVVCAQVESSISSYLSETLVYGVNKIFDSLDLLTVIYYSRNTGY